MSTMIEVVKQLKRFIMIINVLLQKNKSSFNVRYILDISLHWRTEEHSQYKSVLCSTIVQSDLQRGEYFAEDYFPCRPTGYERSHIKLCKLLHVIDIRDLNQRAGKEEELMVEGKKSDNTHIQYIHYITHNVYVCTYMYLYMNQYLVIIYRHIYIQNNIF